MCINASLPPFLNGKGATMLQNQGKTVILNREAVFFVIFSFIYFLCTRTGTETGTTK